MRRHALQAFKFCIGYLQEVVVLGRRASTRQRQGRSNSGIRLGNKFGFLLFLGGTQHQTWLTSCRRRPQVRPNGRGLAGTSPARHWVWTRDLLSPRVSEGAITASHHPRGNGDNFGSLTPPNNFLRWKRDFSKDLIMTQNYQVNNTKMRSKVSIR